MIAVEFKSKIRNNQIHIPAKFRTEFGMDQDKDIRVIVFIEDAGNYDNQIFQKPAKDQFLKGYDESDNQYDFFASAGLWENRDIDAKELRKQAWNRQK